MKNETPKSDETSNKNIVGNLVLGEGDIHKLKIKTDNKKKLVFDAETGELILEESSAIDTEQKKVIDQIYKDGFFAFA